MKPAIAARALGAVLMFGCAHGEAPGDDWCPAHCWGASQAADPENSDWVCDIDGSSNIPIEDVCEGYACEDPYSLTKNVCLGGVGVGQPSHEIFKSVVEAIDAPGPGQVQQLAPGSAGLYNDSVDDLRAAIESKCISDLVFAGCLGTGGKVENACASVMGEVFEARYKIVGSGTDPLPSVSLVVDGVFNFLVADTEYCDYEYDTFSPTSTGESGTGTTGEGSDPFGDIDSLVNCMGNDCEVAEELLENIKANMHVMYEEQLVLVLLPDTAPGGPGVKVNYEGGTPPAELGSALGIGNGDIINEVNGTVLTDVSTIFDVAHLLSHDASDWTEIELKVFHSSTNTCVVHNFTLAE